MLRATGHHLAEFAGDMVHRGVVVRVVDAEHAITSWTAVTRVVGDSAVGAKLHDREVRWWLKLLDRRKRRRAQRFALDVAVASCYTFRLAATATA